mmetsp:Transcript_143205/g.373212  ORF Transcript_143205/g.373212 Transcript_143205/m.373212 type:complete len:515 (-) Transcript_143205:235-1779(-)
MARRLAFLALACACRTGWASPELSAAKDCFVGTGFDFTVGCGKASALEAPLLPCSSSSEPGPCRDIQPFVAESAYTQDVRTASDYNGLTSVAVSAEGGGFGFQVSASVKYMQQSQTTENSVAYFLGQSGTVRQEIVRGPQALKLSHGAKQLLEACTSPSNCEFIHQYGLHYIYSITYGRSFLGSFTFWDKTTSKSDDLSVMAGFSASSLFVHASASAEFQRKVAQTSGSLEKYAAAKWSGGLGIAPNFESPEDMYQTFLEWNRSSFNFPAPLTMQYRSWIDLPEVQEFVSAQGPEIAELFTPRQITRGVTDYLTEELSRTTYALNAVRHARVWGCTPLFPDFAQALEDLEKDCLTHQTDIDSLEEGDIAERQAEILKHDYSWFIASHLTEQYQSMLKQYLPDGICCENLDGRKYKLFTSDLIILTQTRCHASFTPPWASSPFSSTIYGKYFQVPGWAVGKVQDNGDIHFADGNVWTLVSQGRRPEGKPKHRASVSNASMGKMWGSNQSTASFVI